MARMSEWVGLVVVVLVVHLLHITSATSSPASSPASPLHQPRPGTHWVTGEPVNRRYRPITNQAAPLPPSPPEYQAAGLDWHVQDRNGLLPLSVSDPLLLMGVLPAILWLFPNILDIISTGTVLFTGFLTGFIFGPMGDEKTTTDADSEKERIIDDLTKKVEEGINAVEKFEETEDETDESFDGEDDFVKDDKVETIKQIIIGLGEKMFEETERIIDEDLLTNKIKIDLSDFDNDVEDIKNVKIQGAGLFDNISEEENIHEESMKYMKIEKVDNEVALMNYFEEMENALNKEPTDNKEETGDLQNVP